MPVNVTLLFSAEHYRAAADAYMRGRRAADRRRASIRSSARSPPCSCPAGTSPSPTRSPTELKDTLALAVGLKTYQAYRELMDSTAGSA